MSCTWRLDEREAEERERLSLAISAAAREQPRQSYDKWSRRPSFVAEPRDQLQCSLLQRLPLELRLRIYELVFVGSPKRIERWRPAYDGDTVYQEGPEVLDADCFPYRLTTTGGSLFEHPLGLLLSCRRIYLEAQEILYSANEFIFTNAQDLLCFQQICTPRSVDSIRCLTIVFNSVDRLSGGLFNRYLSVDPFITLRNVFQRLRNMPMLHRLNIWLVQANWSLKESSLPQRPWTKGSDEEGVLEKWHSEFFDLLNGVTAPEFFVDLNWRPEDMLAQRQLSFVPRVKSKSELDSAIQSLPQPTVACLYDW